VLGCAIVY
jgi:hypothetical protein